MTALKARLPILAALALLLLAAPAIEAQHAGVRSIGLLWESPATLASGLESFRRELHRLGWVEGQNLTIEYRWSKGQYDKLDDLAGELVRLGVDLIVAPSSVYTGAAKRATSTIPIVFTVHADPVLSGHVASLARPGGNVTGTSLALTETYAKGLELLKEVAPEISRVAVLLNPDTPSHGPGLEAVKVTGRALRLHIQPVAARTAAEFEAAFSAMVQERAGGVLVLSTPLFIAGAKPLADLALKYRLPASFGPPEHAEAGGLFSYGPDRADLFRRAATYVDRILKGARPADLPVERPTKFELVVNLKTAKALGLKVPPSVISRADRVIE
ncbi:MAG TPA: ABC transporter substrate-binding protein [Burkholderiales bacterium]|nr:ABC transporter substrate-binding protein [Burkholderiales bacterium]